MKVNESNSVGSIIQYQKHQDVKVQEANRKKRVDEVRISPEAQEMLSNSQQADDVHSQKIEDLKQAVSTGVYQVDSGKLAEKMLPYLL